MRGGGSRDMTAGGGRRKNGEGGGWRQRSFYVFVARRTFIICIRCVNAEFGMFLAVRESWGIGICKWIHYLEI